MINKRKQRIGRNASCLCGSGKKYKRCCLRRDKKASAERLATTAAPSAPARSVAPSDRSPAEQQLILSEITQRWPPDLTVHLLRAFTTGGTEALFDAFTALPELLEEGGPLDHIRFDPELLVQIVDEAGSHGFVDPEDDEGAALCQACIPPLSSPALVRSLISDASAIVVKGQLPRAQLEAAGIAALTTALVPPDDYASMPALEVVFKVQLAEAQASLRSLFRRLGDAFREARSADLRPTALADKIIAENPALLKRISNSPLLRRLVTGHAEIASDRVEKLIEENRLPPMLTVAEVMRLTTWMLLMDAKRKHGDAQNDYSQEQENLTAMVPPIMDRLVKLANDDDLPTKNRAQYRDLLQAMVLMPERCILASMKQSATSLPLFRHEQELELIQRLALADLRDPAAFDELKAFLSEIGDSQAVATIDQARRDVEALNGLDPDYVINLTSSPA